MKIVYLLLLTLFLNASCNERDAKRANEIFYEATQSSHPIELLKESLKLCFTYEVEFTLLNLQAEQESNRSKKLKLYDKMLETLSQIESNDALVLSEQRRVNGVMAKMYEKDNPLLSNIYQEKAEPQTTKEKNYLPWILIPLLLFLWAFWDFLKKLGNFFRNLV